LASSDCYRTRPRCRSGSDRHTRRRRAGQMAHTVEEAGTRCRASGFPDPAADDGVFYRRPDVRVADPTSVRAWSR
jgi:hypothetical protein